MIQVVDLFAYIPVGRAKKCSEESSSVDRGIFKDPGPVDLAGSDCFGRPERCRRAISVKNQHSIL